MDYSLAFFWTLSVAFSVALLCGFVAEKFKLPALVGYLFAGLLVGSHTPGPVADMRIAQELSEVGVVLLMFGVGLHFSLKDLLRVKSVAVPGAILQMAIATVLGIVLSMTVWHWELGEALVLGLCLSCASTVVLLKALEMQGKLRTSEGQIAVGWLVVEDLATVIILVLLPPVAQILGADTQTSLNLKEISSLIFRTLLHVLSFVVLMLVVGRKLVPLLLKGVAKTGSRELFTLAVLACAIGVAFVATTVFDVSYALGAFFAGMVMQESRFSRRAAREIVTLQDAFAALFFVGVGMMLDWHILVTDPISVLLVLLIIIFGKGITAFMLVHFMRFPLTSSLTVSAALAQIGEFSYILAAQGIALKLVDTHLMSMIVAASILSIALNPFVFRAIPWVRKKLTRYFRWARAAAMVTDPYSVLPQNTARHYLSGQVVLVGTTLFNKQFVERLVREGIPHVSVVEDSSLAEDLRQRNRPVIVGDPTDVMVLVQAHIFTAGMLVISGVEPTRITAIVESARELNPDLRIIVRLSDTLLTQQLDTEKIGEVLFDSAAVQDNLLMRIANHYKELQKS